MGAVSKFFALKSTEHVVLCDVIQSHGRIAYYKKTTNNNRVNSEENVILAKNFRRGEMQTFGGISPPPQIKPG